MTRVGWCLYYVSKTNITLGTTCDYDIKIATSNMYKQLRDKLNYTLVSNLLLTDMVNIWRCCTLLKGRSYLCLHVAGSVVPWLPVHVFHLLFCSGISSVLVHVSGADGSTCHKYMIYLYICQLLRLPVLFNLHVMCSRYSLIWSGSLVNSTWELSLVV